MISGPGPYGNNLQKEHELFPILIKTLSLLAGVLVIIAMSYLIKKCTENVPNEVSKVTGLTITTCFWHPEYESNVRPTP